MLAVANTVLKREVLDPMLPTPLDPVLVMELRLTSPAVMRLPPVMLPVTVNELSVPTEVMLGCAAVVTVPAVVAAPDTVIVYVPLNLAEGTVPVLRLLALSDVKARPLPVTAPAVVRLPPDTLPVADMTPPAKILAPTPTPPAASRAPVLEDVESVALIMFALEASKDPPTLALPDTVTVETDRLAPEMLPVAVIAPVVVTLPPLTLPVAVIDPVVPRFPTLAFPVRLIAERPVILPVSVIVTAAVLMLPPVTLPVAVTAPVAVMAPVTSMLPLFTTSTSGAPATVARSGAPDDATDSMVVPFAICDTATLLTVVMLVRKLPSPMKKLATARSLITLPVATTLPKEPVALPAPVPPTVNSLPPGLVKTKASLSTLISASPRKIVLPLR